MFVIIKHPLILFSGKQYSSLECLYLKESCDFHYFHAKSKITSGAQAWNYTTVTVLFTMPCFLSGEDKYSEINGFNFKILNEKHPGDQEKLSEFKQFLLDENNPMAPMNVWQLQDLSLQTAARYSCNNITKTWIQISRKNWNGFFSNISYQMMISLTPIVSR